MIQLVAERLTEYTARGLATALSRAIGEGAIGEGTKLPPIRTVATELGMSPTTVSAAWQLLARSGAIRSDGRRGTVVAAPRATGPRRYRRAIGDRARLGLDLSTGVPDPALLPDLGPALGRLPAIPPASYLDPPIVAGLEAVLRERWPYRPERLTVVDGAMDALDLVATSLLRLGDRAVVESPCFAPLLDLLDALGVEAVGVPVDEKGMRPEALREALVARPAVVFLQPRAHNPTGASWTPDRAGELARILAEVPVIVEDDSTGDIASAQPVSLGAWLPARTVHIRSFSKSHGPDLRLAAVGGPAALLDPIVDRRRLGQGWTSRLLQHLLLDLLTDPVSVASVEQAKREYARRGRLIASALADAGVPAQAGDGLNLWLPVRDEQAALINLASHGIGAAGGAAFSVTPPAAAHLRVTVGLVAEQHEAVASHLAEAARIGSWTAPR